MQYAAPLFRYLDKRPELELCVYYASRQGLDDYTDPDFSRTFRWNVDLLSGYTSVFLPGAERRKVTGFFSPFCPQILRISSRWPHDAILVPGYGHAYYLLGMVGAVRAGLPVLMRGESYDLESTSTRRAVRNALLPVLFRFLAGYLAIGSPQTRFARRFGMSPARIFPSPYSVDNAAFASEAALYRAARDTELQNLGLSPELPTVLYAAKMIPRKRPMDLIDAFYDLSAAVPSNLLMVGEGTERTVLERRARQLGLERVRFVGFQNQTEMPRYYGISDVFVLPSADEPWGLVVNEAMCAGLPIVVSDRVGAAADLVESGRNGFIYPVGDHQALLAALSRLCADAELRERMRSASLERINRWSFHEVADGLVDALDVILGSRRPNRAKQ